MLEVFTPPPDEIAATQPSPEVAEHARQQTGQKIGELLVQPIAEIKLPTESVSVNASHVDTSNLPIANMILDAYEAGQQSAAPSANTLQSQMDEAWNNHESQQKQDRTEAVQLEEELDKNLEESMTDKLTGLKNREALELLVSKVGVEGLTGVALVDLNDFKGANDNFGHRAGDQVLQRFAALAQKRLAGDENMPGSELGQIFRTGGDEFAIAFYGGRKIEDIQQAIFDIEDETSQISFGPEDQPLPDAKRTSWTAGASIGFASSNEFHDLNGGLAIADQDMFARKEANRPEGYVGRGEVNTPTAAEANEVLPDHF